MENGGRRGFQEQKEVIHTNNISKTGMSPCAKCPYKLGIIKTLINPCPQCKNSAYSTFKHFIKEKEKEENKS